MFNSLFSKYTSPTPPVSHKRKAAAVLPVQYSSYPMNGHTTHCYIRLWLAIRVLNPILSHPFRGHHNAISEEACSLQAK